MINSNYSVGAGTQVGEVINLWMHVEGCAAVDDEPKLIARGIAGVVRRWLTGKQTAGGLGVRVVRDTRGESRCCVVGVEVEVEGLATDG